MRSDSRGRDKREMMENTRNVAGEFLMLQMETEATVWNTYIRVGRMCEATQHYEALRH
jgi:hypothetical protein